MKTRIILAAALAAATLLFSVPVIAQHHGHGAGGDQPAGASAGKLLPVTEKDAAWAAEARKTYPLDVCVVSDEKLGSMGEPPLYIYRVAGQPDRLVIFCCAGCDGDFADAPATFLAKLDAAKKNTPSAKKPAGHSGHHD